MDALGDAALLDRFVQSGDERAFRAIVARHGGVVLGVCRRLLRDEHLAEDAFQQTLVALARHAHRIDCEDTLVRWLHTTAWRAAKDMALRAHRHRERPVEQTVMDDRDGGDQARQGGVEDEARVILDDELRALPERERAMLLLRYVEGRSRAECAKVLGIPIGSTSALLKRAGEALRHRLEARGVFVGLALAIGLLQEGAAAVPPALVDGAVRAACRARPKGGGSMVPGFLLAGTVAVAAAVGVVFWARKAPQLAVKANPALVSAPTVDLYDPIIWEVDEGLSLTRHAAAGGPVLRLEFSKKGRAQAHLRVGSRLPASFRFAYRFRHARSRELLQSGSVPWETRELLYRLQKDGSAYQVHEVLNGQRRTMQEGLALEHSDPFGFALAGPACLELAGLRLVWLAEGVSDASRPDR